MPRIMFRLKLFYTSLNGDATRFYLLMQKTFLHHLLGAFSGMGFCLLPADDVDPEIYSRTVDRSPRSLSSI